AHHGAAAVLRGDVAEIALDRGELHEVLAGRADRVDRELMADEPGFAVERVLRLPRVQADQRFRVAQLDDVVVDVKVDPALRLPGEEDGVLAELFRVGAEEAMGLRRRGAVGARADRAHGEPAGAPHRKARERTGPEAEPVVGMVPRDVLLAAARRGLAVEDHRAETHATELGAHPLRAPRLGPALAAREVDARD